MERLRLIPMVMLAASLLLGLKAVELVTGSHGLTGVEQAVAQEEMGSEGGGGAADALGDAAARVRQAVEAQQNQERGRNIDEIPVETSRDMLLERLGDRREILEQREQDLDIREQLLEAAERRLEERLEELQMLEERVTAAVAAEEAREDEEIGRLVEVYSAMGAKDAAAIFDLLDLPILLEVAKAMNPRKMGDILGDMNPEAARRLTIALAGAGGAPSGLESALGVNNDLPQIEGVPIQ